MPPRITRVRWGAQNIPYGMIFCETTGIFSGKPEVAGEYSVPVTVETNYGKDTKDVKINVKSSSHGVYAIGAKASGWCAKNASPDTNGFYKLPVSEAQYLYSWYGGFCETTATGLHKGHGIIPSSGAVNWANGYGYYDDDGTPADFRPYTRCTLSGYGAFFLRETIRGYIYCCATLDTDKKLTLTQFFVHYAAVNNTPPVDPDKEALALYIRSIIGDKVESLPVSDMVALIYPDNGTVIGWLSEDGTKYSYMEYEPYVNPAKETDYRVEASIRTSDIGYKAIKMFNTQLLSNADFHFLSETNLLDNDAKKFQHGTIKDAWVSGNEAYVQTTDNHLYEYEPVSKSWNMLGKYDVKKLEMPDTVRMYIGSGSRNAKREQVETPEAGHVFILTNGGKLYHKGNAVTGLFDTTHDTLTHIYPALRFKDFTFGGNTLTVLRE